MDVADRAEPRPGAPKQEVEGRKGVPRLSGEIPRLSKGVPRLSENMETIILASASEQRRAFLELMGLPFKVIPSNLEENLDTSLDLHLALEKLAMEKAKKVSQTLKITEKTWVLGADTVIFLNNEVFGKPQNREHARQMLFSMQGQTHEVITAIALINEAKNILDCCFVVSSVAFSSMTETEIQWYLDTNEWQGAAGAYKIQGLASCFISKINGSYSSIVGLPLNEFYAMLKRNSYPFDRVGCGRYPKS